MLNSCLGLVTAAPFRGRPFSRGYGAVLPSSLAMLLPSALGFSPHPPVSVCGTGACCAIAAFPGTRLLPFPTSFSVHVAAPGLRKGDFPPLPLIRLCRSSLSRLALRACVPAVLAACSTGISACCPSAAPCGLALGPDFPRADQLYPGNLGYTAGRIPTFLSLLIPAFSLAAPPPLLTVRLPRHGNAPLPMHASRMHSRASAACFSPGHFRRGASRLVSYYALF